MNKYLIRFLLDENMPHAIRDGLKRRQPEVDVQVIGDEGFPPISAKDEDIIEFLERERYILVSSNRSTMPIHLREHLQNGGHVPGILIIRPYSSYKQIIDSLELIYLASVPEDYQDQLLYIPF